MLYNRVNRNLEPYTPGSYVKITNNMGHVNCDASPDARIACTTFAHWSYHVTGGRLLVADIQGIVDKAGKRFLATDPVIHCVPHPGLYCDMGTDKGITGIVAFFQSHFCTAACRALKLTDQKEELKQANAKLEAGIGELEDGWDGDSWRRL